MTHHSTALRVGFERKAEEKAGEGQPSKKGGKNPGLFGASGL